MKACNPFFINTNICYGPRDVATIGEFSKSISGNTGNSYIAYAMIRLIFGSFVRPDEIKNIYTYDFNRAETDAEYINTHNSHVIFILQDQIRIDESYGLELPFEKIIDFLKRIKKPVIVVSLGANSFTGYDSSFYLQLHPRRVRFFQELSSLVVSLGIRGGFTLEVLQQLGIHNAEVVGCPSFFEEGRGRRIDKREYGDDFQLALAGSFYNTNISLPFYILQDEMELIKACYFLSKDLGSSLSYKIDNRAVIEGRYRAFSSIEDWKNFLKPFHLLFGTRVHGAISALNAGVPSLIINTDSRAQEMSELFYIPYRPELSQQEYLDIPKIYADLDYTEMNNRYDNLYDNYIQWLKRNGLDIGKTHSATIKQPSLKMNSADYLQSRGCDFYEQRLNQEQSRVAELSSRNVVLEQGFIENIGIKKIVKVLAKKILKII